MEKRKQTDGDHWTERVRVLCGILLLSNVRVPLATRRGREPSFCQPDVQVATFSDEIKPAVTAAIFFFNPR